MAKAEGWTKCGRCGSTEQEELTVKGKCLACAELTTSKGETVEVPKAALEKAMKMARSRHPTVCHEDAPSFTQVLEEELDAELWDRGDH